VHWWNDVAEEAKLPPVRGRGFHSLRRKFATEMKHAPLKDLAYLGGWKSVQTVVNIYQRPEEVTMHRALEARRPVGAGDRTQEQFDTRLVSGDAVAVAQFQRVHDVTYDLRQ